MAAWRAFAAAAVGAAIGCGGSGAVTVDGAVDGAANDAPPTSDAPPGGCGDAAGPAIATCLAAVPAARSGDAKLVLSAFRIATLEEGFDLDADGLPDNKMAALGSLAASSIEDAFAANAFIVGLEIFDLPGVVADPCVALAFYPATLSNCGDEVPCDPYDALTPNELALDPMAVATDGTPARWFGNGAVSAPARLDATPGTAHFVLPVTPDLTLPIPVSAGIVTAELTTTAVGTQVASGRIGGVQVAWELDRYGGLEIAEIGLVPEDSLLDAYFANILGPILALPGLPDDHPYAGCRTADVDVDGDGLEAFCDSNPLDEVNRVDVCIDGDGTVVLDVLNPDNSVATNCSAATDCAGQPRFVDGISLAFDFAAVTATFAP